MNVSVSAFQSLCGDCFFVSYQQSAGDQAQHLIIDSGYSQTYHRTLSKVVQQVIERGERINLFVLTHTDSDHIGGASSFIAEFGMGVVDRFWMNYAPVDLPTAREGSVGIRQGITLRNVLSVGDQLNKEPVVAGQTYSVGAMRVAILSPDVDQYDRFLAKWEAQEKIIRGRALPVAAGIRDHQDSVDALFQRSFIPDTSWSNRSSIAFLAVVGSFTGLFTGDAHADVLIHSLVRLGHTEQNPVRLNLLKVAHHGSKGNTSDELLRLVDCQHYLISTNGANQHRLPHKEALARIVTAAHRRRPEEPVHFYFTYDDRILRSLFTQREIDHYNIHCHYPAVQENGITIMYHE